MEKVLLVYYSGTYNTEYITKRLESKLLDYYSIITWNVFDNTSVDIFQYTYDLLIILYPIYAFNAPKYLEHIIKNKIIKAKNFLIIKNSSEPLFLNNSSSRYLIKLCKKKKYDFIGEYHLLMPYHIIFRHTDNMVKQMLLINEIYLDYIIDNLKTMKKEYIHTSLMKKMISNVFTFLGKLQRVGALLNHNFIKVNTKQCIKCKKCINECPVKAIVYTNQKIKVNTNCLMCMRCTTNCPVNAINYGFLNHWKVNGQYDFDSILSSSLLDGNEVVKSSKRFQKVYTKYYLELTKKLAIASKN